MAEQRSKRTWRQELRVTLPTPMRQKRGYVLFGKITKLNPAIVEPSTEMSRYPQQIPAR
jgi:hypothetical protein